MSTDNYSKQRQQENEQGFPIQLKLLLVVISLGVLGILLYAADIL